MQAILEEFDEYLELQCGRSAHTRRAYLGDLRTLLAEADLIMAVDGYPARKDLTPDTLRRVD